MSVANFHPKEVTVIVAGLIITGFAEQMLTVARSSAIVRDERGVEGEIIRYLAEDRRGEIGLTLLQTSASNPALFALVALDELTGSSVFHVIIIDRSGSEVVVAPICWIEGPADITYSKGIETRAWTIRSTSVRII